MARPAYKLFRLIYHSRQTPMVLGDLDAHVHAIIERSIPNNQRFMLTGLLIVVQGFFLQVLEGPEAAVRGAYCRIVDDPRHDQIAIISGEQAQTRLFGQWNMCARALASADQSILDVLDSKGLFDPARLTPKSAVDLLRKVADIQSRNAQTFMID